MIQMMILSFFIAISVNAGLDVYKGIKKAAVETDTKGLLNKLKSFFSKKDEKEPARP